MVEVSTFRRDAQYSDGRHPDAVVFSTPEDDAQRRDFTINGLFYDPLADKVIDYVGGSEDLARGLVRAIGDPRARFAEDKLRMVRAVRIASGFRFALDAATQAAIEEMAETINVVSPERVAQEFRKMLVDSQRAEAVELLRRTRLLAVLLPELLPILPVPDASGVDAGKHSPARRIRGSIRATCWPRCENRVFRSRLPRLSSLCPAVRLASRSQERIKQAIRREGQRKRSAIGCGWRTRSAIM